MNPFKFNLGEELEEIVTGFKGVVMSRTQYFTGCNHYALLSRTLGTNGLPIEWQYFDESRLMVTGNSFPSIVATKEESSSGPHPNPPQMG